MTGTPKGEEQLDSRWQEFQFARRDPAEQAAENHRLRGSMVILEEECRADCCAIGFAVI